MPAKIIRHGKLSNKRSEYITFYCDNPDCECVFKVKDNDPKLKINTSQYGFIFKNKRDITYTYNCPECHNDVIIHQYPDEIDDL